MTIQGNVTVQPSAKKDSMRWSIGLCAACGPSHAFSASGVMNSPTASAWNVRPARRYSDSPFQIH